MRATSNKRTSTIAMLIVIMTLASAAWPQSPLSEEKKKKLSGYDPSDIFPISREKSLEGKARNATKGAGSVAGTRSARPRVSAAQQSPSRTQQQAPRLAQAPQLAPTPASTIPPAASVARTEPVATPNVSNPAPSVESQSAASTTTPVPVASMVSTPAPVAATAPTSQPAGNAAVDIEDAGRAQGKLLPLPLLITLIVIALITLIAMIIKLMKLSARTG